MKNLNKMSSVTNSSRRLFLKQSSALGMAGVAAPWALSLAAMGEAAAATATDYKALVCIFLYGGNDYANTIAPYDQESYNLYKSLRSNLALSRDGLSGTLLNTTQNTQQGKQFALAPALSPLMPIFNQGGLTPILNIGTLVEPTTKQQYLNNAVQLPPKLFSHNDQQTYWQAQGSEGAQTGWGGRIGDLLASGNGKSIFTCISTTGNTVFLAGDSVLQYQVAASGPVSVNGIDNPMFGSSVCSSALSSIMTSPRQQLFESTYATISKRAVETNDVLKNALSGANLATSFPNSDLANQLKMVARLISINSSLGVKRQVFFVSQGGYDTHSGMGAENGYHASLLGILGSSMASFYQATKELGVADKVTTFTGSDFGRTLTSNSSGSDHGWGTHQLLMGDGLVGKNIIGTAPTLANNGIDDVGEGRLLPTTSVDQLGSTLANWFGVSESNQLMIYPNLKNYSTRNLGFMK